MTFSKTLRAGGMKLFFLSSPEDDIIQFVPFLQRFNELRPFYFMKFFPGLIVLLIMWWNLFVDIELMSTGKIKF